MENKLRFIDHNSFPEFLKSLKAEGYTLYLPQKINEDDFTFVKDASDYVFNPYRCLEPLRSFINPLSDKVADYFGHHQQIVSGKKAVLGVKSCDLFSLKVQDYIFLEGVCQDPFYKANRQNTLIISSDCTSPKEVCFCKALGIEPYPQEGFDLNISVVEGGYVVEAGSLKAEQLRSKTSSLWQDVPEKYLEERDRNRKNMSALLEEKVRGFPPQEKIYPALKEGYEYSVFKEEALKCVECGACVFSCPTCHCFLLYDEPENSSNLKTRIWDACQFKNFAKEAGGANPLRWRYERLRNRYVKKFEFFKDNLNIYACTGCGRCIESCIGKIDIRDVLKNLVKEYGRASKIS